MKRQTYAIKQSDITVERPPTGWLVLSALVGGYLVTRKYGGYTLRTAKRLFQRDVTR